MILLEMTIVRVPVPAPPPIAQALPVKEALTAPLRVVAKPT